MGDWPPKEVHITIDHRGWVLEQMENSDKNVAVYPSEFGNGHAKWAIGPIEVARILERLGIRVKVTVERSI